MRPAQLTYKRALTIEQLGDLLGDGEAMPIAGGQGVMRDLRNRSLQVPTVVDMSRLSELAYIRVDGEALEIGAVTTLARVAADAQVAQHCAALSVAAGRVGDVQIRNRGTVGGNICGSWVPTVWSNDIGVVLLASGGEVVVQARDELRSLPARAFLPADHNPLAPGEFIRALRFPLWAGSGYERLSRRWADASIGSLASFVSDSGGTTRVGLAAGRIAARPVALDDVARAVETDGPDADSVRAAIDAELARLDVVGSVQADAAYRRRVLPVLIRRSIAQALTNGGAR